MAGKPPAQEARGTCAAPLWGLHPREPQTPFLCSMMQVGKLRLREGRVSPTQGVPLNERVSRVSMRVIPLQESPHRAPSPSDQGVDRWRQGAQLVHPPSHPAPFILRGPGQSAASVGLGSSAVRSPREEGQVRKGRWAHSFPSRWQWPPPDKLVVGSGLSVSGPGAGGAL